MKKIYIIIISFLLIINILLIYLYIKNNKIIKKKNSEIALLTPRYSGQDTLSIIENIINIDEFDAHEGLLDSSKQVIIYKYPYITKEYEIFKFGKLVYFREAAISTENNEFIFDYFELYKDDSARIAFRFNEYGVGIVGLAKKNMNWLITKKEIGRY